jgi:hypothetical protein
LVSVVAARFQPVAGVAAQVRRFVADELARLGLSRWLDDAQTVVCELVSNVVMHARTEFEVRLLTAPANLLRIEVQDGSDLTPVAGTLARTAVSGRGLMLVQALGRWGVDVRPEGGKTVWCELGPAGAAVPPPTAPAAEPLPAAVPAGQVVVVLADLPAADLVAAKVQMEDLLRELQLLFLAHPDGGPAESRPLFEAALQLDRAAQAFAAGRHQIRAQAVAAAERGADRVTVRLTLPAGSADVVERYRQALDDAERLAVASGDLGLEWRSMREHGAIRRHYLDQVIDQLRRA